MKMGNLSKASFSIEPWTVDGILEEPDMDFEENKPPNPYIPEDTLTEAVNVTITKSSIQLAKTLSTPKYSAARSNVIYPIEGQNDGQDVFGQ